MTYVVLSEASYEVRATTNCHKHKQGVSYNSHKCLVSPEVTPCPFLSMTVDAGTSANGPSAFLLWLKNSRVVVVLS